MKIKILTSELSRKIGKEVEIRVDGEITIEELVKELVKLHPEAEEEFNEFFYIFSVNGDLIQSDKLGEVKVKEGDEVIIIPPVSGG